ncbi:uncharacterized protein L201_004987 [Kwoniella dendrophila CBS 6074]|uniref:Uncharacterized protein n=1 Tax=Kwoniella dendrophila CBS 6074 TaxID=1295534 RepID=A0AAX4JX97_9TREE
MISSSSTSSAKPSPKIITQSISPSSKMAGPSSPRTNPKQTSVVPPLNQSNVLPTRKGSKSTPIPKPLYPPGQGPSTMTQPLNPPSPTRNKTLFQPCSNSTHDHTNNNNIASSSISKGRTPAEAYANLHLQQQNITSKRQLVDNSINHSQFREKEKEKDKEKLGGTKPIFDWISRKLGSRRATISESPSSPTSSSSRYHQSQQPYNGSPKLPNSHGRNRLPSMSKPPTSNGSKGKVPLTSNRPISRSNHLPQDTQTGGGGGRMRIGLDMKREISSSTFSENRSISMFSSNSADRSYIGTIERERRREMNNPYPSIPIPKLIAASNIRDTIKRKNRNSQKDNGNTNIGNHNHHGQDDQTTLSMSLSYSYLSRSPRSRSRSYSLDSMISRSISRSRSRSRSSFRSTSIISNKDSNPIRSLDDLNDSIIGSEPSNGHITRRRFRGRTSTNGTNEGRPSSGLGLNSIIGNHFGSLGVGIGTGTGIPIGAEADDDASLRPFPPSHPASPTPSNSVLIRTSSNPISPINTIGNRSRTNTFYSTWSGLGGNNTTANGGHNRSFTSSSLDGLYGSTYRYSYDRRRDSINVDHNQDGDHDGDEEDEDEERGRESRQDSTSTKPTTCISFDSTPAVAHIAQSHSAAPQSQQPQIHTQVLPQTQHVVMSDQQQTPAVAQDGTFGLGGVINSSPASSNLSDQDHPSSSSSHQPIQSSTTRSSLNIAPPISTSPTHHLHHHGERNQSPLITAPESSPTPPTPTTPTSNMTPSPTRPLMWTPVQTHIQAPKHTPHHPIYNPIPNGIPDDNASMLTLASSTFGQSPNQNQNQDQGESEIQDDTENHTQRLRQIPIMAETLDVEATVQELVNNEVQIENEIGTIANTDTPQLPTTIISNNDKLSNDPPSIQRLKDNHSFTQNQMKPSSITTPSIHWAPTPTPLEERPISNYENNYNYNYPPSTHLSTATSIISFNHKSNSKSDRDASVRAIRRKGSWESYESGWSWRGLSGGGGGGGDGGWNNQQNERPISFRGNNSSLGYYGYGHSHSQKAESYKSRNDDLENTGVGGDDIDQGKENDIQNHRIGLGVVAN